METIGVSTNAALCAASAGPKRRLSLLRNLDFDGFDDLGGHGPHLNPYKGTLKGSIRVPLKEPLKEPYRLNGSQNLHCAEPTR